MARTTSSPPHKIQLYQFKDFDMSEFINRYLHLVNPHEVTDPTTLSVYRPAQTMMTQRKEGARSEAIIENKCKYLQDVIIRRAFSKKDNLTLDDLKDAQLKIASLKGQIDLVWELIKH